MGKIKKLGKKPILVIVAIFFLFVVIRNKSVTANAEGMPEKAGYKKIYSVKGVEFQVKQSFVDRATAVTQVAADSDFLPSEFYSYTDGETTYLMFYMEGIVIACQKGTTFNFDEAEDKKAALESNSLSGIWFHNDSKKLKVESKNQRSEITVNAAVSITTNLFGDFAGKLVTLKNDEDEWSLFVGCLGDSYEDFPKDVKKGIDDIAETFAFSSGPKQTTIDYAYTVSSDMAKGVSRNMVSVNTAPVEQTPSVPAKPATNAISENIIPAHGISENSVSDDSISGNTVSGDTVSGNTVSDDEIEDVEIVEAEEDATQEISEEPTEQEASEEPTEQETTEETVESDNEDEDVPSTTVPDAETEKPSDSSLFFTNDKTVEKDDNMVYESSLYSMLKPGDAGVSIAPAGKGVVPFVARVTKIYESADEYAGKDYILPAGCHWEAAEYDVFFENEKCYVDVRLIGADGKNLKFRGIKYPMRTFDVKDKNMVYYAVPNGCNDYVLKVGGIIGDSTAAYYHINNK